MSETIIVECVKQLADNLNRLSAMVVTAESCTGGSLSAAMTSLAGSSNWFERGLVTYSNNAKQELLGVKSETLEQYGAVSEETAAEMATGAVANSSAQYSVSITGIAGPDGGSEEKPVGTVCLGWHHADGAVTTTRVVFEGEREQIRQQACLLALRGLLDITGADLQ